MIFLVLVLYSIMLVTGLIGNNEELTTFQSMMIGIVGIGVTAILYALDLIREDIQDK